MIDQKNFQIFTLLILVVTLTGCVIPPEAGSSANLRIVEVNVTDKNDAYHISVVPDVTYGGNPDPFRNVSLVTKDESGNIACQKYISDQIEPGELDPVSLTCDDFPYTVMFDFDRDPCARDVYVTKRVYNKDQSVWTTKDMEC